MLEVPPNASVVYLAEGAANVVFRLEFAPSSPPLSSDEPLPGEEENGALQPTEIPMASHDPAFDGQLLRLRKVLTGSPSNAERSHMLTTLFEPLLPAGTALQQQLLGVSSEFLATTNELLRELEQSGTRPARRAGVYLDASEEHGFLVQDMSSAPGEAMIEFKPKWLVQSRSAPKDWKRCRTCALLAKRNAEKRRAGKAKDERSCPLDLASGDTDRVLRAVRSVVHKKLGGKDDGEKIDAVAQRIAQFFCESEILKRLRTLQDKLDSEGVLKGDIQSQEFAMCMTLRDCTVFVKVFLPAPPFF
jgi:inositol-pentakisphosphate 2-kinase